VLYGEVRAYRFNGIQHKDKKRFFNDFFHYTKFTYIYSMKPGYFLLALSAVILPVIAFTKSKSTKRYALADESVNITGLQIPIIFALNLADGIYNKYGQELIITSALDGVHMEDSLHYEGLAVDLRTYYFTPSQAISVRNEIANLLGSDYDVILEPTHLHIEYQPK